MEFLTINQAALFFDTTGKLLRRRLLRVPAIADEVGGVRDEFRDEWLPHLNLEWPTGDRPTMDEVRAVMSTTTTTTSTTTSTTVRASRSTGTRTNRSTAGVPVLFDDEDHGVPAPKEGQPTAPAVVPAGPATGDEDKQGPSTGPRIPVWAYVLVLGVFALVDSIAFGWIAYNSMEQSLAATGLLGLAGVGVAVAAALNNLTLQDNAKYNVWAKAFLVFQIAIWAAALFGVWILGKLLIAGAVGVAFWATLEGLREKFNMR